MTAAAVSQPLPGRLNNAIATAAVEVHKRYMGRGPTKARALSGSDVVVLLMETD